MANEEHVEILERSVEEWNQWRKEPSDIEPDLSGANFLGKHLAEANLNGVDLRGACLTHAELNGADLFVANLSGAKLYKADLSGANLNGTDLRDADFTGAIVDGKTLMSACKVNKWKKKAQHTNFTLVSLDACRIDSGTKQLLEYNIRRSNWEHWYKDQRSLQKNLVKWFWGLSDYGLSSKSIIQAFFSYAFVFGVVYYFFGVLDICLFSSPSPGVVNNLFSIDGVMLDWWRVPLRSIYFSIVTMTTLGFGDMSANPESKLPMVGYILLMIQVLLGYVMLGALITRFAILFQAGGPAGKFEELSEDEEKELEKIRASS